MNTATDIFELFSQIGFRETDGSDQEVVVELPTAPHVMNTNGGLQGGLLATLVDVVAGKLAMRQLAPGETVVTSDLHLHYLRAVTSGSARATARITHCGKRSMVIQVEVIATPGDELALIATVRFTRIRAQSTT